MGSIFSAIGRGIMAIISAIAGVLMAIVGAITTNSVGHFWENEKVHRGEQFTTVHRLSPRDSPTITAHSPACAKHPPNTKLLNMHGPTFKRLPLGRTLITGAGPMRKSVRHGHPVPYYSS
ncbi:hypothetical protein K438DRAFT_1756709 [Mycena galopus ATCC 62051]|nr:hypothetical protein K438DRAFT_1756709 [Mycena galopus ATCC 62051]